MSSATRPQLRLVPGSLEADRNSGAAPATSAAPDDSSLLAGLRDRDSSVCAAFYDRVRPIVDRTLSRLLGTKDADYEDVAQIALYEIIETIGRFRGECPLDAWLSIVTARAAYRQIRRRKLERRLFSNATPETTALTRAPAAFASRQAVERLRSHLLAMDEGRAWSYLLHDVYGYALQEVSQILNVSVSAAQSRLVRGRREIHDRIENDPELAHFLDDLSEEVP